MKSDVFSLKNKDFWNENHQEKIIVIVENASLAAIWQFSSSRKAVVSQFLGSFHFLGVVYLLACKIFIHCETESLFDLVF